MVGAAPDLLIFLGGLTWGPLPEETWALVRALSDAFTGRTILVRGNAERVLSELHFGEREPRTPRETWMLAEHSASTLDALATFAESVTVEITGLGRARSCHGSPRSDEELVTPATPPARIKQLLEGMSTSSSLSATIGKRPNVAAPR